MVKTEIDNIERLEDKLPSKKVKFFIIFGIIAAPIGIGYIIALFMHMERETGFSLAVFAVGFGLSSKLLGYACSSGYNSAKRKSIEGVSLGELYFTYNFTKNKIFRWFTTSILLLGIVGICLGYY